MMFATLFVIACALVVVGVIAVSVYGWRSWRRHAEWLAVQDVGRATTWLAD